MRQRSIALAVQALKVATGLALVATLIPPGSALAGPSQIVKVDGSQHRLLIGVGDCHSQPDRDHAYPDRRRLVRIRRSWDRAKGSCRPARRRWHGRPTPHTERHPTTFDMVNPITMS